jgi:hypothetical protein
MIGVMCRHPASDRVWIEIDPAREPIAGVVHDGSEPDRPFAGWLELVALLEATRRPGADRRSMHDCP